MRIGVLGGTFNPIHIGHLIMAQSALEEFRLDKVLFIPCAIPPHKKAGDLARGEERLGMLREALAGNPAFEVCDLEIRRSGKSYSYDTMVELRANASSKDEFFFIIGVDSLEEIMRWHRIRELVKLCKFIVVERSGISAAKLLKKIPRKDRRFFGRHVHHAFPVGICSRQIRDRIGRGLSVRYMVSEPVEKFLAQRGLYKKT